MVKLLGRRRFYPGLSTDATGESFRDSGALASHVARRACRVYGRSFGHPCGCAQDDTSANAACGYFAFGRFRYFS